MCCGSNRDQLRYLRQIHAAEPTIAVDPNKPATARPRLGGAASAGVGVGLTVGSGDDVGSSVPRAGDGVADALVAGVGAVSVSSGVAEGDGDDVGGAVGSQNGKHGVGGGVVGGGVEVGGGVGVGEPGN